MGVVYRAFDREQHREVALKTLRDQATPDLLDRLTRELEVLKSLHHHPGIVPIYSFGTHEGKPYFTMPILAGATLREIIEGQPHRLTPPRVVEIISHVCKGLQAAHDLKLIHRDVKPSNIFVLEDDSAVIIDFGIASLVDRTNTRGLSGSPPYMSPEQLELRGASPKSDIFSLGVVCYEALSLRHPFPGPDEAELHRQIRTFYPPSVSELNPAVNHLLSQVVSVAMAKSPRSRFESAREFMELLQAAVRNLPIERFSEGKIEPRLAKAMRALDSSDYELAAEILDELRAEGWIHPQIDELREQVEKAQAARRVRNLLTSARNREEHEEFEFALQKLDELLTLDPINPAALEMQGRLRARLKTQQHDGLIQAARRYAEKFQFARARESLRVLTDSGDDGEALNLFRELEQHEREYEKLKAEKDRLRQSAILHWQNGDLSLAVSQLEKAVALDRQAPDTATEAARAPSCQSLYEQVRTEHEAILNALSEGRRLLGNGAYAEARAIIAQFLEKYQEHPSFKALLFDIDERERQELYTEIAQIAITVDKEPDLDRRVSIVDEALAKHPLEKHLHDLRARESERRDLVNGIVARAHNFTERDLLAEALAQWQTLRTIYPRFTGLEHEIATLQRRLEQKVLRESRARTLERIDQAMSDGYFERALGWIEDALGESPGDAELLEMQRRAHAGQRHASEANRLFRQGLAFSADGNFDAGFAALRRAVLLEPKNAHFRGKLVDLLVQRAEEVMADPDAAEALLIEARDLDPANARVKAASSLLQDRRRESFITFVLTGARSRQAEGDLAGARLQVEAALERYPEDARLKQLHARLLQDLQPREPTLLRQDLDEVLFLSRTIRLSQDPAEVEKLFERLDQIRLQHPENAQIRELAVEAEDFFRRLKPLPLPPQQSSPGEPPPPLPLPPSLPPPPAPPIFVVPDLPPPQDSSAVPPPVQTPPGLAPAPAPAATPPVPWRWLAIGALAAIVVAAVAFYFVPRFNQRVDSASTNQAAVQPGPAPPPAPLAPPPGTLKLAIAITSGDILIDGEPRRPSSPNGPFEEMLAPGQHKLEIRQNSAPAFSMAFELRPGGPPNVAVSIDHDAAAAMSVFWNQGSQGVLLYPGLAGLVNETPRRCPKEGCAFSDLPPGSLRLRLTKIASWFETYSIADAPTLQIRAGDARFAPLELTSNAEGATVTIDGKAEGVIKDGRFRSRLLLVGNHTVALAHPDHEPAAPLTAEVKRAAGNPLNFPLTAKPKLGRVRVSGTRGARLALGRQNLGDIPGEFDLPVGRHILTANLDGYDGASHSLAVEAGKTVDVRLELVPMPVVVTIIAPPAVRVFHRPTGASAEWTEHDRARILSLAPASVDFECRGDGLEPDRRPSVMLLPGQPFVLRCAPVRKADAVKQVALLNQQAFPELAPRKKGGFEVNRRDSTLALPPSGTLVLNLFRDSRATWRLFAGESLLQFIFKDDKILIKANRGAEFIAGGGDSCTTAICSIRFVVSPASYEIHLNGKLLHQAALSVPNPASLRLILNKGSVVSSSTFTPAH